MILIPAIDIKSGQCVRLFKGRFEEKTVYGDDPAAMARRWADEGAKLIHLVDLDGSLGDNKANRAAVEAIRKAVDVELQLGGGIRGEDDAARWFDLGLNRLILGTVIFDQPALLETLAAKYPGRLAVGLDAVGEELRIRGWKESSGANLYEVAKGLKNQGASLIIYTDVERDGTQDGPNVERTEKVLEVSGLPVVASGGVAAAADLESLLPLGAAGLFGVISGKALYEGSLNFAEGRDILARAD